MYKRQIQEELKKLPQKPGVYLMKDENGHIIYVGKAVNLKNRVRQYFQSSRNQTAKTRSMVPNIREFEYIVTDSEMEALLLECNLIKKHHPYYNILLKDDKSYPYIKVTVQEMFPRIFITRRMEKDKAKYYGPFTDVLAAKETVETLHKPVSYTHLDVYKRQIFLSPQRMAPPTPKQSWRKSVQFVANVNCRCLLMGQDWVMRWQRRIATIPCRILQGLRMCSILAAQRSVQ